MNTQIAKPGTSVRDAREAIAYFSQEPGLKIISRYRPQGRKALGAVGAEERARVVVALIQFNLMSSRASVLSVAKDDRPGTCREAKTNFEVDSGSAQCFAPLGRDDTLDQSEST